MESMLKDWFTYNYEANKQFIRMFSDNNIANDRAIKIFSHVLNAQLVWLSRLQSTDFNVPAVWQIHPWETFDQLNDQAYQSTMLYLQSESFRANANQPVVYGNAKGEKFSNTASEICFQLLTHSAYHRGQIALLLRDAGIDPPLTDFIFYKRQRQMGG